MSNKVKVGLIGCGRRLIHVANNTFKPAKGGVEIAAVFDPEERAVARVKENFGEGVKVYPDYKALIADKELDWVMIGSWNCFHAEQAIAAFKAGKNVFCEKPLGLSVEECLAMRDAWKESGKEFIIGFVLRYSPHYKRLKHILDSGKIGDIVSMEFNETLNFNHGGFIHSDWRRKTEFAGSHLLEKCCHDIDLVNWLVGSRAKRVASFGGCNFFKKKNEHYIDKYAANELGKKAYTTWYAPHNYPGFTAFNDDKDIVDNQVAIIEFENNVRTTFHTNCNTAIPERRMYFCGTEGTLRADVYTGEIEAQQIGFYNGREDLSSGVKGGQGGGDEHLGRYLAKEMLENKGLKFEVSTSDENLYFDSTLEDGLMSAFTAYGIDRAAEEGTVIDMSEYWEKAGI